MSFAIPAPHLTCGLFHTCGWWMSVSLTIVFMGFTPEFGNHNITVVAFRRQESFLSCYSHKPRKTCNNKVEASNLFLQGVFSVIWYGPRCDVYVVCNDHVL